MSPKETIIFDLGGVLIDWDPRYLYRKIFPTEAEVNWFLETVCTQEWNEQQDAGRSFAKGIEELVLKFPAHENAINAWFDRWEETIGGPKKETVHVLRSIHDMNQYRLYALTNWSAETFPWALSQFDFLSWFDGIVVSGVEKALKPHPEFFHILFDRYSVDPNTAIFIDDNMKNVETAQFLGMESIHFLDAPQLHEELLKRGVLVRDSESK